MVCSPCPPGSDQPLRLLPRRRVLLLGAAAAWPWPAWAAPADGARFAAFLAGVARAAGAAGIPERVTDEALAGLTPSARVLALTQAQPELVETWAAYRAAHVTARRIGQGRALFMQDGALFNAIGTEYGVPASVLLGIWGLESNYGAFSGNFPVLRALATLGCFGDRPGFFRAELLDALRILATGRVPAAELTGSYAGAMGQPQFMPSTYLRYAVDFDGDGRRDIWTDRSDVLASIANYLRAHGWRAGLPWGLPVSAPPALPTDETRPLAAWRRAGVRPLAPGRLPPDSTPASLLRPDSSSPDLFLVFTNFQVIRAYNRSNFYALSVGLLGDDVVG